ncbi:hypothetical protein SteCoe_7626 [Stentor coeruleus]|uniref:Uncharacterized protein n=1 Tax=Stentor coeruleus TaxID=5963 RepID=A0A1R2CMB2_9CILI|nr:hypothetical protein SteCoe_7626 [Stentor coeruleus]
MELHKRSTSSSSDIVLTSRCATPRSNFHMEFTESHPKTTGCIVDMTKYKKNLTLALPSKTDSVCWISKFPQGEYQLIWDDTSAIIETITQKELEDYCQSISAHCSEQFIKIKRSKVFFRIGLFALLCILFIIFGVGFVFKIYWISIIDLVVAVIGLFLLYNYMKNKLESITIGLKLHIKEDNLEAKSIKTKIGKYGTYIAFRLILAPVTPVVQEVRDNM